MELINWINLYLFTDHQFVERSGIGHCFAKHGEHYSGSSLEVSLCHKQYEAVPSRIPGTHHNDPYTK